MPEPYNPDDWVILEQYTDGGYSVLVEGQNRGENPLDDFEHSNPDFYQVVYKTPWRTLIHRSNQEPTPDQIHSALKLAVRSPEFMYVNAKMNVLKGLFMRLGSMSKQKGYCMVCGKNARDSAVAHDSDCILRKALAIIQRPKPQPQPT